MRSWPTTTTRGRPGRGGTSGTTSVIAAVDEGDVSDGADPNEDGFARAEEADDANVAANGLANGDRQSEPEVPGAPTGNRDPIVPVIMSEFEDINGEDGPEVLKSLASCTVKWDKDVEWFLSDLEMRMELLSIKTQWYKRIVLANNLPDHVKPELKYLLKKNKTAAGATIYKDLKMKVIELFCKIGGNAFQGGS